MNCFNKSVLLKISLIIIFFANFSYYGNLYAQEKESKTYISVNDLFGPSDSIFNQFAQRDLDLIDNIKNTFYRAYKNDKKFIQILEQSKLNVDGFKILGITNSIESILSNLNQISSGEKNASVNANSTYDFTPNLLMDISDKSIFAAKKLISYYVDKKATDISDLSIKQQKILVKSTLYAWLLAHEIAHQYLGHNDGENKCNDPESLAGSRECEIEADSFSFYVLDKSGYSLIKLNSFFSVMSRLEIIKLRLGKIQEEELSSHPSWWTRYTNLQYHMLYAMPVQHSFYVFSTFYEAEDKVQSNKMTFILQNDPDNHMAVVITDNTPEYLAYEISNDTIKIYQRDGENIYEFFILDKNSYESTLEFRAVIDKQIVKNIFTVFKDDMIIAGSVLPGSGRYKKIFDSYFNFDRRESFKNALLAFNKNEQEVAYGIKILEESSIENGELFLDYTKSMLSLSEYLKKSQEYSSNQIVKLQKILTEEQINKLQSIMLSNLLQ